MRLTQGGLGRGHGDGGLRRHQRHLEHRNRGGTRTPLAPRRCALLTAKNMQTPPPFLTPSARSRHARTAPGRHARHSESRCARTAAAPTASAAATGQQHAHARRTANHTHRARPPRAAASSSAADTRHHTHERRRTTTTKRCCVPTRTHGRKAGDAGRWGTAELDVRSGNGVAAFLLPCERGSHRHTASSQGPASALRFNYYYDDVDCFRLFSIYGIRLGFRSPP